MGTLLVLLFRRLLALIGIVGLLWFVVPGIFTGNIHIGIVTGAILSALLIIYGFWGGWINMLIRLIWNSAVGKFILCLLGIIAGAIIGLAVACMVSMGSANRQSAKEDSTVVVLGCHVYKSGPSRSLVSRLKVAAEYLNDNPDSICIVTGGQGSNEYQTEASAMKDWLVNNGIDADRIIEEDTSTDTWENLTNAKAIIDRQGIDDRIVIATNDYHMYRALSYAQAAGFDSPGALNADTLWWLFPGLYVREMYGILEMWFLK